MNYENNEIDIKEIEDNMYFRIYLNKIEIY